MKEVYIVSAARTAQGSFGGALASVSATKLGSTAIAGALKKAGMEIGDVDLIEVNEAFASVVLRFLEDLNIDESKINVNGGAIAMGHPLGATGAMLMGTLIDELERQDKETGLVTLCVGGGMGIATIIERV